MRVAVNRLLDPGAGAHGVPPAAGELEMLTLQLRGHLQLLAPEIQQTASRLPRQSPSRCCVLACLGEARMTLDTEPEPTSAAGAAHARQLARVLNALLDHHENLA